MMKTALSIGGVVVVVAAAVLASMQVAPADLTPVRAASVSVDPATVIQSCQGPARVPGSDSSEPSDPAYSPAPAGASTTTDVVEVAPHARLTDQAATVTTPAGSTDLTVGEGEHAGVARTQPAATLVTVTAEPLGRSAALVAGTTATLTPLGDLRGLAAASCQSVGSDFWLVGGATTLGSSARLVLDNPSGTAASVQMEAWGPAGPVSATGSTGWIVPATSERAISLEGLVPDQRRIAVHITATGAAISAAIQDSSLSGLIPTGVDYVSPSAAPSRTQSVTGLSVESSAADTDNPAVVRVLVPGEASTDVTVSVRSETGPVDLPDLQHRSLGPGTVTDLSLAGVPAGTYTVTVTATHPIVIAGMVTRVVANAAPETPQGVDAGAGSTLSTPAGSVERAWSPSRPAASSTLLAGAPALAQATLVLSSPKNVTVEASAILGDGTILDPVPIVVAATATTAKALSDLLPAGQTPAGQTPAGQAGAVVGVSLAATDGDFTAALVLTRDLATARGYGTGIAIIAPDLQFGSLDSVSIRAGRSAGL